MDNLNFLECTRTTLVPDTTLETILTLCYPLYQQVTVYTIVTEDDQENKKKFFLLTKVTVQLATAAFLERS